MSTIELLVMIRTFLVFFRTANENSEADRKLIMGISHFNINNAVDTSMNFPLYTFFQ